MTKFNILATNSLNRSHTAYLERQLRSIYMDNEAKNYVIKWK